jgi:hypothetical protein
MKFTLQDFFTQAGYFRQLMGDKTFWAKADNVRQEAINGLTYIYTNTKTDSKEDEETLINIFTSTVSEYTRREIMVALMPVA